MMLFHEYFRLTGIVEVELPMDEKLRNIEETEKAKRKILEDRRRGIIGSGFIVDTSTSSGYRRVDQKGKQRGKRKNAEESKSNANEAIKSLAVLPGYGNYNANFAQHRPTRELKESVTGTLGSVGKKLELSSDDIVMEKFKKRFQHRR